MNPNLIPLVVAAVTVLPGVYLMAGQRKKANAEAAETIVTAATKLIQPLLDGNAALTHEVRQLKETNGRLAAQLEACMVKLERLDTRNENSQSN